MFSSNRKASIIFGAGLMLLLLTAATFTIPPLAPGKAVAKPSGSIDSTITYQGYLTDNGALANGAYDFQFILFDAVSGGLQAGSMVTVEDLPVTNGMFTAALDFGSVFDGTAVWLEISVRAGSSTGAFSVLSPRQPLTAAPYALGLAPGAAIKGNTADPAMSVMNSGGDGMQVDAAGGDGLQVGTTGNAGVRVQNAGGNGIVVEAAALNGYRVSAATLDGLRVVSAGQNGLSVEDAAATGLNIDHAAGDGIFICATGSETTCTPSATNNGIEIANAESYGIRIASSGSSGVFVDAPVGSGLVVSNAGFYGVRVVSAADYAGYFGGNIFVNGSCTGCLLAAFAINTSGEALQPGELVTILGTRPGEMDNAPMLMEVAKAGEGQPVVGVVQGRAEMIEVGEPGESEIGTHLIPREGAAAPGGYANIVFSGPIQVKASALDGTIPPGARLTAGADGQVRALQTRVVEGMPVSEGAPVIGVALSEPDENGMVWVLIDLQ